MTNQELKKILYVEDDPNIQLLVKLSLEDFGDFELKVCSSGKEALQVIEEFQPDLLLLDVMMPEMDGPTTLVELRKLEAGRNKPAIFLTAKVHEDDIAVLKQHENVIAIISKPFDPTTLSNEIQEAWRASLQTDV